MRLLLKNGIVFTLVSFAAYISLFALLYFIRVGNVPIIYRSTQGNVFKGGLTWKKFRDFRQDEKYDIIVLGTSHAYRGYDPEIFKSYGYKLYNFGTFTQSQLASYVIARNYIRRENCSTVIIDVYDRIFKAKVIESLSDITQNISSDLAAAEVCLRMQDLRAINMFAFRIFCKFDEPLNQDIPDMINGFQAHTKVMTLPGETPALEYVRDRETLRYFSKLIDYLQREGIHVIVAEHPLPYLYTVPDVRHKVFTDDIRFVTDHYKVRFYDYMNDSTLTKIEYFADENHMNNKGVEAYNHKLIRKLIKDGDLPPPSR